MNWSQSPCQRRSLTSWTSLKGSLMALKGNRSDVFIISNGVRKTNINVLIYFFQTQDEKIYHF